MDFLFVGWDDGCHGTAHFGFAFGIDEVIGTESYSAFHDFDFAGLFIEKGVLYDSTRLILLHHPGLGGEIIGRGFYGGAPVLTREVMTNGDAF